MFYISVTTFVFEAVHQYTCELIIARGGSSTDNNDVYRGSKKGDYKKATETLIVNKSAGGDLFIVENYFRR